MLNRFLLAAAGHKLAGLQACAISLDKIPRARLSPFLLLSVADRRPATWKVTNLPASNLLTRPQVASSRLMQSYRRFKADNLARLEQLARATALPGPRFQGLANGKSGPGCGTTESTSSHHQRQVAEEPGRAERRKAAVVSEFCKPGRSLAFSAWTLMTLPGPPFVDWWTKPSQRAEPALLRSGHLHRLRSTIS